MCANNLYAQHLQTALLHAHSTPTEALILLLLLFGFSSSFSTYNSPTLVNISPTKQWAAVST